MAFFLIQTTYAYELFAPKNDEYIDATFNFVVKNSSAKPGMLEVSLSGDFNDISFCSDGWVYTQGWWQLPAMAAQFCNGTNYWRIVNSDGTSSPVWRFKNNLSAAGCVDPHGYELFELSTSDGPKMYWFHNLWTSSPSEGTTSAQFAQASASLFCYRGNLYIPVFRTDDNIEANQQFRLIDAQTGVDNGLATVRFTNYSGYRNRRYEECGVDDAGNIWMASEYNPIGDVSDLNNSYDAVHTKYYSSLTYNSPYAGSTSERYVRLLVLDMTNPQAPKTIKGYMLAVPPLNSSDTPNPDTRLVSGIGIRGNLNGTFEVHGQFSTFNKTGYNELDVLRWFGNSTMEGTPLPVYHHTPEVTNIKAANAKVLYIDGEKETFRGWIKGCDVTIKKVKRPAPIYLARFYQDKNQNRAIEVLDSITAHQDMYDNPDTRFTGNALTSFKIGDETLLLHNSRYDTESTDFTLYATPAAPENTVDVRRLVRFPQSGLGHATLASQVDYRRPAVAVAVGDLGSTAYTKVASFASGADIYVCTADGHAAAYRLEPHVLTDVNDAYISEIDVPVWNFDGISVWATGCDGTLRIFSPSGVQLGATTGDCINISELMPGVYIAQKANSFFRFIIRK